ncbi:phosphotriesterase [Catenulispora sp. NF23]|uniref:Phosphotriesterase n=1 Tax=Catenulispora pinistramenti TaxID=2705254 RepID=A0ABS5KS41_9ACTN|nr:phosphotriesterase [Catenulispora pinistramenti]MBS2534545.1 phosphotriesterase [Catenulispora pinistramenti]MBS2548866.1 phosphotriesterase [Catenulispora pinistramenti]
MIRTVLGDIAPAALGVTDSHDHLFFASAKLPGQELDDPAAAEAELRAFAAAGGQGLAQWTPMGLGRRAGHLAALSEAAGVHLIAATGLHQAGHYPPETLTPLLNGLAERFIAELTEGLRQDGDPDGAPLSARAGLVKVAGDFHQVDRHASMTFEAAAAAHHATGVTIAVHLEGGTHPLGVLKALDGVPASSVILGHLNRFPDLGPHREAAEAGAFLGFDGPSRANHATDWRLFDCLAALIESGHTDQILLGGDTTSAAGRAASGGGPGIPYLLTDIRARVLRDFGPDVADAFFLHNPARAFDTDWQA